MSTRLVLLAAAFLFTSCGAGAASLESEFARQINEQIKDEKRCIDVGNALSPSSDFSTPIIRGVPGGDLHRALERAGLGTTEVAGHQQLFRFNELGLSLIEQGQPWDSRSETYFSYKLCYAHPVLREIVQYTEPADFLGSTVTSVTYAITMEGFPDWATDDLHPQIKRDRAQVAEPYVDETLFEKTNKGWKLDSGVPVHIVPDPLSLRGLTRRP